MTASSVDARLDGLVTKAGQVDVDCVLAPVDPARAETVSPELVTELLEVLRSRYDHIVVDTASQLSEVALAALDAADHHVLVTAPDVASVKNLRLTLDTFDLLSYPQQRRTVVLNRAGATKGLTAEDVGVALGRAVDVAVPDTVDALDALNRGEPLVVTAPAHPTSVAIRALAERLSGTPTVPARAARRGLRWRKRSA